MTLSRHLLYSELWDPRSPLLLGSQHSGSQAYTPEWGWEDWRFPL